VHILYGKRTFQKIVVHKQISSALNNAKGLFKTSLILITFLIIEILFLMEITPKI